MNWSRFALGFGVGFGVGGLGQVVNILGAGRELGGGRIGSGAGEEREADMTKFYH
jgi:hypothetical protein